MDKRILVVDDERTTLTILKKKLELAGFVVHTASNGMEGLDVVTRNEIDLIVTDVVMPIMDGVDFYKALKSQHRTANIPIIIITDKQVFIESFRALGVDQFIAKPIDTKFLIEQILHILSLEMDRKIVVVGDDRVVTEEICFTLEKSGCRVAQTFTGADFIASAIAMVPQIALIDILLKDLPAREIIRALKCFKKLRNCNILAYTQLPPEAMSDVSTVDQLKQTKDECMEAGATSYIGRFSRMTLFDNLRDFWVPANNS